MPRARLVPAGVTLRDQVNKKWGSRDKASDGWLGDAKHQARTSDHNADKDGWVHAIDIDEDFLGKGKGQNIAKEFADQLIKLAREGKDGGRLKYVVYENRVASGTYPNKFWVWRDGNWGHTHHIHVSFTDKAQTSGAPFNLPIFGHDSKPGTSPLTPSYQKPFPGINFVKFGAKNDFVKEMQKKLIAKGFNIPAGPTGNYGIQTANAVKNFYGSIKLTTDGKKMGPKAWDALWRG